MSNPYPFIAFWAMFSGLVVAMVYHLPGWLRALVRLSINCYVAVVMAVNSNQGRRP